MKTKEEIEQLAFLEFPRLINDPYNPMEDDNVYERQIWIDAYTKCQEDMTDKNRKEVQPEDIWNKENQDKIKEHILIHAGNQSPEDKLETELAAKKYTEEDNKDKKYTYEDMRKAFFSGNVMRDIDEFNYFLTTINSLNKQN
jgi:glycogen synthase